MRELLREIPWTQGSKKREMVEGKTRAWTNKGDNRKLRGWKELFWKGWVKKKEKGEPAKKKQNFTFVSTIRLYLCTRELLRNIPTLFLDSSRSSILDALIASFVSFNLYIKSLCYYGTHVFFCFALFIIFVFLFSIADITNLKFKKMWKI